MNGWAQGPGGELDSATTVPREIVARVPRECCKSAGGIRMNDPIRPQIQAFTKFAGTYHDLRTIRHPLALSLLNEI